MGADDEGGEWAAVDVFMGRVYRESFLAITKAARYHVHKSQQHCTASRGMDCNDAARTMWGLLDASGRVIG